jgi:hypothetical protein
MDAALLMFPACRASHVTPRGIVSSKTFDWNPPVGSVEGARMPAAAD